MPAVAAGRELPLRRHAGGAHGISHSAGCCRATCTDASAGVIEPSAKGGPDGEDHA